MVRRDPDHPLTDVDHYNSKLMPSQAAGYQKWLNTLPEGMDRSGSDYDLHGAYLAGEQPAVTGHLTDRFKKPNHPTFSQESQYSTPENQGGQWSQPASGVTPLGNPGGNPEDNEKHLSYVFKASPDMMKTRTPEQMNDYFRQQEPKAILVAPLPDIPYSQKEN